MLYQVMILIWIHFIADFVLQTREIAKGKSSNIALLGLHCLLYTIPFLCFGWKFALINGLCHFLVDFATSKATSYLWKKEKERAFFTMIGFDQAIHLTILVGLLMWIG